MARLRVVGDGEPLVYQLAAAGTGIGRAAGNAICLADQAASSRHAEIIGHADGWRIEDRGSMNGTFVNGQRVTGARLADGDQILIGATELRFEQESDDPPATTREPASGLLIDEADISDALGSSLVRSVRVDSSRTAGANLSEVFRSVRRGSGEVSPAGQARTAVEMAEAKLLTLQRVSEKLVRVLDPRQLNDEIMSIVLEQTGADRGILCLLDENRQPRPIASRGVAADQPVRLSRTVLNRLLDERSGVLINQDPDAANVIATLDEMGVVSTLCAPLWTGEEIIGLLSVDSTQPGRHFTEDDLELLLVVAHQAAIGIQRGRLTEQVADEQRMRSYLSNYLDHRLIEQITGHSGDDDPLAPQERVVTVLFADIVSFTKMSEGLAPTELAGFVREYLTVMTDAIFAHGGTIDKYIGDAVMALFGAPVSGPDDAAAAVRAALEMRRLLPTIRWPGASPGKLRTRFGINTDLVVVGNIGSARRMEYTAVGDGVNVASRIGGFARPNEICIDEDTYKKTAGQFDVEEIGAIDVKNRLEPLVIYKVLADKKAAEGDTKKRLTVLAKPGQPLA